MTVWFLDSWTPDGDYGSEFKIELDKKKKIVESLVVELQKHKNNLEDNFENSKISEDAIEVVDGMIRKLEYSQENLQLSIDRIELYQK